MNINNSFRLSGLSSGNFAASGTIANNIVDACAALGIAQTTANISLTLSPPTVTDYVRELLVFNTGNVNITVEGLVIVPAEMGLYLWNGSVWVGRVVVNRPWRKIGVATDNNVSVLSSDNIARAGSVRIGSVAVPIAKLHLYGLNTGVSAGDDDMWLESEGPAATPEMAVRRGRQGTTIDPLTGNPVGMDPCLNTDLLGTFSMFAAIGAAGAAAYTSSAGIRSFYDGNGTTTLSDLIFFTSGLDRAVIDSNGKFGINNIAPHSYLHSTGSVAYEPISINSNTTLTDIHSRVFCANGAFNITITLPAASTCVGRFYVFSRTAVSTGTITITAVSGQVQSLAGAMGATTTIAAHGATGQGVNIVFRSDGVNWYR
jgi:hypothetical protein